MGIMFNGWAREEAEEELWYIKKYGLEAGQVAYQQYLKEQEAHRKWCQENPKVIRWSKSEPKITDGDIIGNWDKESGKALNEAVVQEITEEGKIVVRYLDNRRDGQPTIWEGEYQKMCSSINE